jgi:hypothetical protein
MRSNRSLYKKYRNVSQVFNLIKNLIFKKKFFLIKNFFFDLNFKYKHSYLFTPIFVFEKQFLFKFIEYNTLITDLNVSPVFLKNIYNFDKFSGINYLLPTNFIFKNNDPKDVVFFSKLDYNLNYNINTNYFELNLNRNISFFLLVDFYKILIFLNFIKLINF